MVIVTIQSQITWEYFWFPFLLYALYVLYILCHRWMLCFKPWNCKSRPNARAILPCSIVWCWGTPSTGVCSWFTAIRFRQKCSTEVIEWTSSWFGRRASIMELSLCRQSQSGMLVYCSCSLLLLWPTLDQSLSIVPSYQPWKHMMILKMVIILLICFMSIMRIIAIIVIIAYCFVVGWLESVGSRVVY